MGDQSEWKKNGKVIILKKVKQHFLCLLETPQQTLKVSMWHLHYMDEPKYLKYSKYELCFIYKVIPDAIKVQKCFTIKRENANLSKLEPIIKNNSTV